MTSRGRWFLGAAFIFYMFANQTQIGWLYVIAGLLVGLVIAAGLLNRGAARGIRIIRVLTTGDDENSAQPASTTLLQEGLSSIYETDPLILTLTFVRESALPAVQVSVTHLCPLAAPESDEAHTTLYVPMISREVRLQYRLAFPVYLRGVHHFPPIQVSSAAPFGFFAQTRTIVQPDPQVVYPEYHALSRFPFFDRRDVADQTRPKAGVGSEVIGVRPYRQGDPIRHIHWPSVARTGQLVSKEFAQEMQPRVALVLDRHALAYVPRPDAPFEILVKSVLSVGDYALRQGFTVTLHADETELAHPYGPMTREMLLDYLARVTPHNGADLEITLAQAKQQGPTFVVLFTTRASALSLAELVSLSSVLIVMTSPASEDDSVVNDLSLAGVSACVLPADQDWTTVLAQAGS